MFQVIQIAYWLALSTWFGGVLFVAIAAPIIFRTVREADPTLPRVLSVNLEGQHATLLAGTIVANLISTLFTIELLCAGVLLFAILGQWFFVDRTGMDLLLPLVRTALFLGAVGFVLYDWRVLWPRIIRYRDEYIEHADEPEVANPAKDQFDRYQQDSVRLLSIVLAMLLGLILFSGDIRGRRPAIPQPDVGPAAPSADRS